MSGGAATLMSVSACGQPPISWRMATSWPKSLDIIYGGVQIICDRVSEMTNGRFKITPYSVDDKVAGLGKKVEALQVLDAVERGEIECGHTCGFYYLEKSQALSFATGVPFGLNAQQQNAWLYHGGGLEEIRRIYKDFGIINFPAGNTGVQMGGWFKRQVNTQADLEGLKMRISGVGGQVMSKLGVNVEVLPASEIYNALDAGTIEAAEWIGPYDDEKLGLNKVASLYYYPGWWEPGTTFDALVNLQEWNRLPKEYQKIFETATYEANIRMLARYDSVNREALRRLTNDGNTELVRYSDDIINAAENAAWGLYEENARNDRQFKQVYDQWRAFREDIKQWHGIHELTFDRLNF
ncbi:MAG: ABC transporter substrate-binding protein [Cyanobacteriota bacterium]|nr:ABC transporter substrate-binding protein [Cyanobacteriota bacterium]